MPSCGYCHKEDTLRPIKSDWNGRKFHKQCHAKIRTMNAWFDLGIKSANTKEEKDRIMEVKANYNAKLII
jgi:hypothetical protein